MPALNIIDGVTADRASAIVRQHLKERFTDELSFGPIVLAPKTESDGSEYLEIYIVFDGNQSDLDPGWTVGLPDRLQPQIAAIGFSGMLITSWVHSSEWEEFLKENAYGLA